MNNIMIFESGDQPVQVRLEGETVWLTQAQVAELFSVTPQNVTMHLKNIYEEQELVENATCKDFLQVQTEGDREVKRKRKHYNLDAIISVGYRVNSRRATQFRIWATSTLRQHLVEGYTLNQQRLRERGIEFEQALDLLSRTLANQQLVSIEGEAVLRIIADYARSWSLLQGYDEQSLTGQTGKQQDMRSLQLDDVLTAIAQLKAELMAKGEATELFGQLRGDGLASSIATIEQGSGDELFYPNVASRAAHLLYFVTRLGTAVARLNPSLPPEARQDAIRDKLRVIAHELLVSLRENVAVDWAHRESARARLRVLVKRSLRKYGYPPDLQDAAVQTVLQQAEALSSAWSAIR